MASLSLCAFHGPGTDGATGGCMENAVPLTPAGMKLRAVAPGDGVKLEKTQTHDRRSDDL
jgi:hypothetical protein